MPMHSPVKPYRWLDTMMCLPPHRVTHWEKFAALYEAFVVGGWGRGQPALLGYDFGGYIQLVTGSHRWWAADAVPMKIPVSVYPFECVKEIWGTDCWVKWRDNAPLVESGTAGENRTPVSGSTAHRSTTELRQHLEYRRTWYGLIQIRHKVGPGGVDRTPDRQGV